MGRTRLAREALAAALAAVAIGCSSGEETAPATGGGPPPAGAEAPSPAPVVEASAQRGKQVYQSVCIACHAYDPTQDGAAGPAIAGSSLELLEAKVLRNEYPPGYTPKRTTSNMIPLLHVEKDLPSLAAYLAAP